MMKYRGILLISLTILLHCPGAMATLTVTPMQDPAALVDVLAGEGIQIVSESIVYHGDATAAGTFSNGKASGLEMDAGVLLRTGSPESARIPRANTLEFQFTSTTQELFCQYTLATEEYSDTGMPVYPDILKLYVDGKQVALLPDGLTPLSLRKLIEEGSLDFYDNRGQSFQINYSGFTAALTAVVEHLNPARPAHHFKLLAMNEGDPKKHSAIFIAAGSCRAIYSQPPDPDGTPGPDPSAVIPEPGTLILFGFGLLGLFALAWRRRQRRK